MKHESKGRHNTKDIKAENDFLKMKMMLERGAEIGSSPGLDPELENQFLNSVMAFEQQFDEHKTIKLYDKIDRPTIFRPVADIADAGISSALDSLLNWLEEYNITVDVVSPNISVSELYRFITEELFEYEMDDINLPGWTSNFIYDEFHPDSVYETTHTTEEECIKRIFCKEPLEWMHFFAHENIRLNEDILGREAFKKRINNFKDAYDNIECTGISEIKCSVEDCIAVVAGRYMLKLTHAGKMQLQTGKWMVNLETQDNFYWEINSVRVEGIGL